MLLMKLFLLFTLVPAAEIYILMKLGASFGVEATFFLVIGTGFLGAWLAKREGLRSLTRINEELALGKFPADELINGLLVLAAGILLLTPGLLTDICGLLALFSPTRAVFRAIIKKKIRDRFERGMKEYRFFLQH